MPPTHAPITFPTNKPTIAPTSRPTRQPTSVPSYPPTLLPTLLPSSSPSIGCEVDQIHSFDSGLISFSSSSGIPSIQHQKLTITTDKSSTNPNACVMGSIAKYGFEPPFNIGIVIDISGSTTDPFGGNPTGDVNNDGFNNTILDAEIASILNLLQSISASAILDNSNVDIGLISFATDAVYHGRFSPLDTTDRNKINAVLRNKLMSLRAAGWTNFDDALDKAVDYFKVAPSNRNNLLFFISEGIPKVAGDGDGEVAPSIIPKDNQASARVYTSELLLLDTMGVIRVGIGVGLSSEVITGSALHMIDNTIDEITGSRAQQVTTSNALTDILLHNPVVGAVIDLKISVNGNLQPNIDVFQISAGPFGYSFGTYIVSGLFVGINNKIEVTVVMDFDKNVTTKYDQLNLTAFTIVSRTA
jgi:hypothetical protein